MSDETIQERFKVDLAFANSQDRVKVNEVSQPSLAHWFLCFSETSV